MEKHLYDVKQFCNTFDNLFNEQWLIPLLYKYYKLNIIILEYNFDNMIKIYNFDCREPIHTLSGHTNTVQSVIVHDNKIVSMCHDNGFRRDALGNMICVAESHTLGNTIKIWDLATGQEIYTLQEDAHVRLIAVQNNKIISRGNDQMIKIWDLETGKLIRTLHEEHADMTAVYDNKIVICDRSTINIWDIETGCLINTLHGHTHWITSIAIYNTIIPNVTYIISGSNDATIKIWDLETGELIRTCVQIGNHDQIRSIDIYNNMIISVDCNQTLKIWDPMTGCLLNISPDINQQSTVIYNGLMIPIYDREHIKAWDLETDKKINIIQKYVNGVIRYYFNETYGNLTISGSCDKKINLQ